MCLLEGRNTNMLSLIGQPEDPLADDIHLHFIGSTINGDRPVAQPAPRRLKLIGGETVTFPAHSTDTTDL